MTTYTKTPTTANRCGNGDCPQPLETSRCCGKAGWMLDHSHPGRAICDACCTVYCRECAADASTDGKQASAFTDGWLLTVDAAPDWSLADDLAEYSEQYDDDLALPASYDRRDGSVMAGWPDGSAVLFRRFTEGGDYHEAGDLTGEYLVLAPAEAYALAVLAPPSITTKWASDDPHATVVGAGGAVGWAHASVCFGCERRVTAVFTDDELDDDLCAACYARDCIRRDN